WDGSGQAPGGRARRAAGEQRTDPGTSGHGKSPASEGWSAVHWEEQRSGRADRAPGRCRAGGGVLGGTTPPAAFVTLAWFPMPRAAGCSSVFFKTETLLPPLHAEQQDVAIVQQVAGLGLVQDAGREQGIHLVEEGLHPADVAAVAVQVQLDGQRVGLTRVE